MNLSIEEFRKLPRPERERRYIELSAHDKFIARMEDWEAPPGQPDITTEEFLANPPKGWESITKEMLEEMFPGEKE